MRMTSQTASKVTRSLELLLPSQFYCKDVNVLPNRLVLSSDSTSIDKAFAHVSQPECSSSEKGCCLDAALSVMVGAYRNVIQETLFKT